MPPQRAGGTTEGSRRPSDRPIKETIAAQGLKMPQLAMALRVLVCGQPQTPSIASLAMPGITASPR